MKTFKNLVSLFGSLLCCAWCSVFIFKVAYHKNLTEPIKMAEGRRNKLSFETLEALCMYFCCLFMIHYISGIRLELASRDPLRNSIHISFDQ
jgi:hypothetical protein